MGSSNLDYRGSGFWVRDHQAEAWLYLLAQEAGEVPDAPGWLAGARADWHIQATAGFMGCVSSCLDQHLGTDPDRVALTLDLSHRVMRRLADWSGSIPGDVVDFAADMPTGPVEACGRAFIRLLRGEFPPGYDRWAE